MRKIAQVQINLDESDNDENRSAYKCGSIISLDSSGETLRSHDEIIDDNEYRSKYELILSVAYKIGVDTSSVSIVN